MTPLDPNSGVLVLPKTTTPASSQRCTTVLVCAAVRPTSARHPSEIGRPAEVLVQVLEQERHTGERARQLPGSPLVRVLVKPDADGVDQRVHRVRSVPRSGQQLDGRHLAAATSPASPRPSCCM